ncbi:hypothetical protein CPB86DRAFT_878708 [Serendipita vermifera]|nr:hypothetical protein CPB86DRAFT_878708 [Serendipita vermifera]
MTNMAVPPPVSKYRSDTQPPGHTAGQPSITSVTSTALSSPTSQSSHAPNTAFSPTTTITSLNPNPRMDHPTRKARTHGSAGGQGGATGVSRSHSASAALPPSSTSSSITATSFNNYPASSGSYAGSNSHLPGARKPIPAQRRKPVPQHLPATAEVSPFPTLLVVNREYKVVASAAPFEYPAAMDGKDKSAAAPPTIVSLSQVKATVARERPAVSDADNMVDPVPAAAAATKLYTHHPLFHLP